MRSPILHSLKETGTMTLKQFLTKKTAKIANRDSSDMGDNGSGCCSNQSTDIGYNTDKNYTKYKICRIQNTLTLSKMQGPGDLRVEYVQKRSD